jgi:hypothetical protein
VDDKVTEAVIDPHWRTATMTLEGQEVCVLSLDHPRHGTLSFILPSAEARKMGANLNGIAQKVGPVKGSA